MFTPCYSSPDSTPPPTSAFSSPTNLLELTSAISAMGINLEHHGPQLSTDFPDRGVPDWENLQLTDYTTVFGCHLAEYFSSSDTQTAELLPFERFLREGPDQNRVPSLVRASIPTGAVSGFCAPPTAEAKRKRPARVGCGKRNKWRNQTGKPSSIHVRCGKGNKRRNKTRKPSSIHVEAEPLSAVDRVVRDFGERGSRIE